MTTSETIDGLPIDGWEARFSGSVDLDNTDALAASFGDEVLLVVSARVKQTTIRETATGDVRRVQIYKPGEVRAVLNSEMQAQLRDELGLDYPDRGPEALPATSVKQHVVEVKASSTAVQREIASPPSTADSDVADLSGAVPVPSSPSTRGASAVEHDEHLRKFLQEEAS